MFIQIISQLSEKRQCDQEFLLTKLLFHLGEKWANTANAFLAHISSRLA